MRIGIVLQGIGLLPIFQFAVTGQPMEDPLVWHACTIVALTGVVIFVIGTVRNLLSIKPKQ